MKEYNTLENIRLLYLSWLNGYTKIKESTKEKYIKILNSFFDYLDSQNILRIKDISQDELWHFLHINAGRPFAHATTVVRFSCIDLFYRWAYENKFCLHQPTLLMKKSSLKHKKLKKETIHKKSASDTFLSLNEQKHLLIYLSKIHDNTFNTIRNRCIVLLMLSTGLRLEELVNLKENAVSVKLWKIRRLQVDEQDIVIEEKEVKQAMKEWQLLKNSLFKDKAVVDYYFVTHNGKNLKKRTLHQVISTIILNVGMYKRTNGPILLRQTAIFNAIKKGKSDVELSNIFKIKHQQIKNYRILFI